MYQRIFDQLNDFLTQTLLVFTPLNPDAFQGVFIKKLSNQNIVREKRRHRKPDPSRRYRPGQHALFL